MAKYDPLIFETIKNSFTSIPEEAAVALRRTGYSSNIKEREDISVVLLNKRAEVVAFGWGRGGGHFCGDITVREGMKRYPLGKLREGDIIIVNDPFAGNTHVPDITLYAPIVVDAELVGIILNRAHHADVGGKSAGSMPSDAEEIFEEGLVIPPVALFRKGQLVEDMKDLILRNVRTPEERWGDLMAQISAIRLAERRLKELVDKYGKQTVLESMDNLIKYSERMVRNKISGIPDGIYEAEKFCDDDGIEPDPIRFKVKITIQKDTMHLDFTGTNRQTRGPVNVSKAFFTSHLYLAVYSLFDDFTIPWNQGLFNAISFNVPEGSIINPSFPAATVGGAEMMMRMVELIATAMAPAIPDKVLADTNGAMHNVCFGGRDPRNGRRYTYYETIGGGYGGRSSMDGMDGVHAHASNTLNTPIELFETAYPLRVERYELIRDSGGAGKFRGGLGIRRDIRVIDHRASFSCIGERHKFAPEGLFRGGNGTKALTILNPGTNEEEILPGKVRRFLEAGDLLSIRTSGGAGYGNPKERDVNAIERDITLGKLSLEKAREEYGYVIDSKK